MEFAVYYAAADLKLVRQLAWATMATLASIAVAAQPVILEQNWSAHDRAWFYHVNQGSRLIDYRLFLALEALDGGGLFRNDDNLRGYGFIPAPVSQFNPDRLPIGFARDRQYLGLACAACHTSEFEYNGSRVRIEGGQGQIDLQRFLGDLERALEITESDAERKRRLLARMALDEKAGAALLHRSLAQRRDENARNHTELRYGPARLDAFGAILNKGLALTGVAGNHNPPDGPTSFPYLWDTPHHDWVEWNGSSANSVDGALGRNVGEVIGVYGEVSAEREKLFGLFDHGYRSSLRLRALRRIEKRVARLQSPLWPERYLTSIDKPLAVRGKPLYEDYCAECHQPIARSDPRRRVQVRMSSLAAAGTDPTMARNVLDFTGSSGRFTGEKRFYVGGEILSERAPALSIVNYVMVGVVYNHPLEVFMAQRDARTMGHGAERHPPKFLDGALMARGSETSNEALAAYKARPLNGVWATAPYLHNGSVPNLYELLLPANERSRIFALGGWRFDPERVGYATRACDQNFVFDTALKGNSNAGHEYGTGADGKPALSEPARLALLEYLKTL